jgi:hypothetical protein
VTGRQSANGRRRRDAHEPADWADLAYQPAEGTPLIACRCGGRYLNDPEGRGSHQVVFGHRPNPREPEQADRTESEP